MEKKIMIIAPIDPTSVLINGQEIFQSYFGQADVICPQMLALIAEDDKHAYPVNNICVTVALRDNFDAGRQKNTNYDIIIVFGNCDKSSTKFDHIVTVKEWWTDNTEDKYIIKSNEVFGDTESIDWFTYDDAEYAFPTLRHLKIFLKTLGANTNDKI